MDRTKAFAVCLIVAMAPAAPVLAWGDPGHRYVTTLGLQAAAPTLPAFLRSPKAVTDAAELAREPDRSRLAGEPHDGERDPDHFLKLDDGGRVIGGGPALAAMPATREAYALAFPPGATSYQAGHLYYALVGGWQQLVKDFAYWRVLSAAERSAKPADRAWLRADRQRREAITIRDLGYWSHFVGDSTQPQHVSVHYEGWGEGPNPQGFSTEPFHWAFEGPFVTRYVGQAEVKARMRPAAPCAAIAACVVRDLQQSGTKVAPLYRLWTAGAFKRDDPAGRAFAADQLGEGASRLRDYIAAAWRASGEADVTFSRVKVADAEAGKPINLDALKGLE